VDVTNSTSQWLYTGDKLLFTISDWSYEAHAANLGVSPHPAYAAFDLLSLPQAAGGNFAAWWEAADGSVVAGFPSTLSWLAGRYQSSVYTGPVSVLYGSMYLPQRDAAVLVVENLGGPVHIGMPQYTLAQDLTVSFSGGGFGASGIVTRVQYLDPPVPEPASAGILLAAGVGLCVAARIMNRMRQRHIQ
jgi:hypothetical protein